MPIPFTNPGDVLLGKVRRPISKAIAFKTIVPAVKNGSARLRHVPNNPRGAISGRNIVFSAILLKVAEKRIKAGTLTNIGIKVFIKLTPFSDIIRASSFCAYKIRGVKINHNTC